MFIGISLAKHSPGLHWKLHPYVQERLFGSIPAVCVPLAVLFTVSVFALKKKTTQKKNQNKASPGFRQKLAKCSKARGGWSCGGNRRIAQSGIFTLGAAAAGARVVQRSGAGAAARRGQHEALGCFML